MNKLLGNVYRNSNENVASTHGACIVNACFGDTSSSCSSNFCGVNEHSGCVWFACGVKGESDIVRR